MIENPAARAAILTVLREAKQIGARRPADISRDATKHGDLYAIFTYGMGSCEIHASLSSGLVWFYGPGPRSGGAPLLRHEAIEPETAAWVAQEARRCAARR